MTLAANVLVALLAIGLLIALHELGHLVAARLAGMRVERYSIGFGWVLARRRFGDTEYCLSAIPFGGYVKIAGMAPGEDEGDPRAFHRRPLLARVFVIAAGPLANELVAVLLVYAVALAGMPYTKVARVGQVLPESAAAAAGLSPGDLVRGVNGAAVTSFPDLVAAIRSHPGETVALEIDRDGKPRRILVQLGTPPFLGVSAPLRRFSPIAAVPAAIGWTVRQTAWVVTGTLSAFRHPHAAQLEGPIGTIQTTAKEAEHGWQSLVFTLALLSLALAVFNVLPWPSLDGGRLLFLLFEILLRRPVNRRIEMAVHAIGMVFLIALVVLVTVGDVRRLAGGAGPPPAGGADAGR